MNKSIRHIRPYFLIVAALLAPWSLAVPGVMAGGAEPAERR